MEPNIWRDAVATGIANSAAVERGRSPCPRLESPSLTRRAQVFATNPHTYISITAHSGTIQSFLTAVNHQPVSIQPGGLIPVVVKAVK